MANLPLKMVTYRWDYLTPLALGDVVPEGIDLQLDMDAGIAALHNDDSFQAGESSIGHYMLGTSRGNHDWVGLTVFPMRAFRHRCFLVRRGSPLGGLTDLKQLEGKRVGLDGWPNSGNTWTKVLLRQEGADIWKIAWTIAPIQEGNPAARPAPGMELPANVKPGPAGKSLVDLLLADELDVLVAAFLPRGFFEPDCPIVHMIPDFSAAEAAHFRRVGYMPAHHLLIVRREVIERDPWIARSLTGAFEAAKAAWQAQRRHLADTTPWVLAELERTAAVFGDDWNPFGLAPNLKMLTDFCQDQYAQRLVDVAVEPNAAFADYTRFMT